MPCHLKIDAEMMLKCLKCGNVVTVTIGLKKRDEPERAIERAIKNSQGKIPGQN